MSQTKFLQLIFVKFFINQSLAVSSTSNFYTISSKTVTEDEVLEELSDIQTKSECLLRCKRNEKCVDIALQGDKGVCYLLDDHLKNGAKEEKEEKDVKRISPFIEPFG